MSDQVNEAQEPQAQQPPSQADLELQSRLNQHLLEKSQLLNDLAQAYSAFTQKIAAFDVPLQLKQIALQHFDTGFLWVKEAIQIKPLAKAEAIHEPQGQDAAIDAA